jgi:hypothetical protein
MICCRAWRLDLSAVPSCHYVMTDLDRTARVVGCLLVIMCPVERMSDPVMLHVACIHCGQKLTLQFTDWPETLEARRSRRPRSRGRLPRA